MEWMICNSCGLKVEGKQSFFHLTQCGHLYCGKCIMKAEEQCFQCGSVGTISLPLTEPLNPQISHYFTRPADLLEKVLQVKKFRDDQFAIDLKQTDATDTKYQSLKEAYWLCAENLKKLIVQYNKSKMTLQLLKKEQQKYVASSQMYTVSHFRTPPNHVNNPRCSQQGHNSHKSVDSIRRSNEVFKVPSVPRSGGYFSASSLSTRSSNYRMETPQSKYSGY